MRYRPSKVQSFFFPGITSLKIKNTVSDVWDQSLDENLKCETTKGLSNIGPCLGNTKFQQAVDLNLILVFDLVRHFMVAS